MTQPGIAVADRGQDTDGPVSILNISAVDDEPDQMAKCVGADVALATLDPLAGVEAANTAAFGGLDARLSMTPAVGLASRPSTSRAAVTRWLIVFRTPGRANRKSSAGRS